MSISHLGQINYRFHRTTSLGSPLVVPSRSSRMNGSKRKNRVSEESNSGQCFKLFWRGGGNSSIQIFFFSEATRVDRIDSNQQFYLSYICAWKLQQLRISSRSRRCNKLQSIFYLWKIYKKVYNILLYLSINLS